MFARRAGWDLSPNPLSERVAALRAAGRPLLDLADSNPTRCGIGAPAAALRDALTALALDPAALRYTPEPRGDAGVRAAIAACHARGGAPVSADHVVLTAGTSEGYAHVHRLLADPGDRVHLPTPGYPLFAHLAELEGLDVALYPLRASAPANASSAWRWRIDLDALAADLTPRSRMLVVIDPHNPTGAFLHPDDRAALVAIAAERRMALVFDEVFADYATPYAKRADAAATPTAPLELVLSGASKLLGLPQLKVAWIVAGGEPALRDEALARLEFVGDAFLSVSPLAASVLPPLLRQRATLQAEIRARVATNLAKLAEAAKRGDFQLLTPEAGWSAILRLGPEAGARAETPDEEALALGLLDGADAVQVQPGFWFDLDPRDERGRPCAHLVVSLLPEPERFARGVDAIAALRRGS